MPAMAWNSTNRLSKPGRNFNPAGEAKSLSGFAFNAINLFWGLLEGQPKKH